MEINTHFPSWVTTLFIIIGLWSFAMALNESIKLILILSFLVPMVAFILWKFNRPEHLQNTIYFRNTACAFSIILSFLLFANHDKIDLSLARNILHKFSREYYEDTDGDGKPYSGYNYDSNNAGNNLVFYIIRLIFFASMILLPYLTYLFSKKYIDKIETRGDRHSKMVKNLLEMIDENKK